MKERINIFLSVMFWIIIHLGRNPRKGGNPPKDKKLIINENFRVELFILIKSCFIKKMFNVFISKINKIEINL